MSLSCTVKVFSCHHQLFSSVSPPVPLTKTDSIVLNTSEVLKCNTEPWNQLLQKACLGRLVSRDYIVPR